MLLLGNSLTKVPWTNFTPFTNAKRKNNRMRQAFTCPVLRTTTSEFVCRLLSDSVVIIQWYFTYINNLTQNSILNSKTKKTLTVSRKTLWIFLSNRLCYKSIWIFLVKIILQIERAKERKNCAFIRRARRRIKLEEMCACMSYSAMVLSSYCMYSHWNVVAKKQRKTQFSINWHANSIDLIWVAFFPMNFFVFDSSAKKTIFECVMIAFKIMHREFSIG